MSSLSLTLYHIYALIIKELLATLKDPKSRVILIVPVLVQGLLFGYTATYNLEHVPYAVVDEDHSHESAEFLSHLIIATADFPGHRQSAGHAGPHYSV